MAPSIRKKLTITSPTSGGGSVGIVRSRTQTMEFSLGVGVSTTFQMAEWWMNVELERNWKKAAVV
jgi:hypothetical protein